MTTDPRTALNTYATEPAYRFAEHRAELTNRRTLAPAVFEALRQVLAIHEEASSDHWLPQHQPKVRKAWCNECRDPNGEPVAWPCPTVAAVSASLAPKED